MKSKPSISLLLLCLFTSLNAAAQTCVDISGNYRPPNETPESDPITTLRYVQNGCDSLSIGGISMPNSIHSMKDPVVFNSQTFWFQDLPATQGLSRVFNSYPWVRDASYQVSIKYIIQTIGGVTKKFALDPTHGICFYRISHLFKDENGDLLEEPQFTNCEDGFTGTGAFIRYKNAD